MPGISKGIYLIDDNEHPYYGYEFDDRGLAREARGFYPSFCFAKVFAEYETFLRRRFRKVTSGTVTLEANFIIDCPDGFCVRLYNEEKTAYIGIQTKSGAYSVAFEGQTDVCIIENAKNSL